jgi:ribonuclease P protein component
VKRRFRLTKKTDFKRVRLQGKSFAHPLIVLILLPSSIAETRFAVTAGRSLGNAIQRNRAKRLIRAAIASYLEHIPPSWYGILIARKPMGMANFVDTQSALAILLRRAKLIAPDNER